MKHPEKSAFSFGAAFNQLNEFRATKMLEWLFTNQQSLAKENCSLIALMSSDSAWKTH